MFLLLEDDKEREKQTENQVEPQVEPQFDNGEIREQTVGDGSNSSNPQNTQKEQNGSGNLGKQDRPVFRLAEESTPARRVAEGAMLVALATVLGILAYYLPVFGIVAVFLWPIPIAFLIKRHGVLTGILALGAVGFILGLITGPVAAITIVLNIGFVGIWYGLAFRKNYSGAKTLFVGVVVAAASVICMLLLSAWTMGLAVGNITSQINEMVKSALDMYQKMGVLETMLGGMSLADFTAKMQQTVKTLLPASLIMMAMAEALVSYLVTGAVFRRLGYQVNKLPVFTEWHLPWVSLWGLIIALVAQLGVWYLHLDWLQNISLNVLYLYLPILVVAGISLVFWFAKKNNSSFMKVVLVIAIILLPEFALYILLMMGLMDSVVDIRKFLRNLEEQAKKMGKQ